MLQHQLLQLLLLLLFASTGPHATAGLELRLDYAPASPMARRYHQLKLARGGSTTDPRRQMQVNPRTLDLGNAEGGVYYVTLEIGTPPRPYRVNLDTGSATLSVPASFTSCPSCDPHFDRGYDGALSSTYSELPCTDATCGDCSRGCGNPNAGAEVYAFLNGGNECRARPGPGCQVCHETCAYAGDGECDDGSQGGTQYCASGSDPQDCGVNCCLAQCCAQGSDTCAFSSVYGDGSGVSGKVVADQVSFGGTGQSRLGAMASFGVFDKTHDMDSGGPFEGPEMDGIFGIAGGAINDGRVPVLDAVLDAAGVANVFALCLQGQAGTTSTWDIGQLDHEKYVGDEMKCVPAFLPSCRPFPDSICTAANHSSVRV
jgi:hypothetical protein